METYIFLFPTSCFLWQRAAGGSEDHLPDVHAGILSCLRSSPSHLERLGVAAALTVGRAHAGRDGTLGVWCRRRGDGCSY